MKHLTLCLVLLVLAAPASAEFAKPKASRVLAQPDLNQADKRGLDGVVRHLKANNEAAALREWHTVVEQALKKPGGMKGGVNAWIRHVMHEVYSDDLDDLKSRIEKAEYDSAARSQLRAHITDMREQFSELAGSSTKLQKAQKGWPVQTVRHPRLSKCCALPLELTYKTRVLRSKKDWKAYIELLDRQLEEFREMNELKRIKLQQAYQNQNKAISTLSSIMKSQHDTLKAIISNMRG